MRFQHLTIAYCLVARREIHIAELLVETTAEGYLPAQGRFHPRQGWPITTKNIEAFIPQQPRDVETMLVEGWPSVADGGTTLKQHCFSVSCQLGRLVHSSNLSVLYGFPFLQIFFFYNFANHAFSAPFLIYLILVICLNMYLYNYVYH